MYIKKVVKLFIMVQFVFITYPRELEYRKRILNKYSLYIYS
jgi:hypothetical protein